MANVEGLDWFQQRLPTAVSNGRVWVISSPEMIRCQHSLRTPVQPENEQLRIEDDLDHVCLYRLNALVYHLGSLADPYRTAFFIQ